VKAAVIYEVGAPLEIQEMPDPTLGPADAVIRVEACGICRSDWHLWQGDLKAQLPLVPGHEFAGVVAAVGQDVKGFRPGDRVTLPFHLACGHCEHCYTGHSNLCGAGAIGFAMNGGYAQLARVPNADVNLIRLPEGVDFVTAASLGCRYMTAYHGVVDRAQVRPGEWVAVFGAGGVGLSAVQIASAIGARVIAVDISDEKLMVAKGEGAELTVNAASGSAHQAIKELTGGGANVSIDALGSAKTAVPGVLSLKKGGRHLQIGLTGKEDKGSIALPVDAMTLQELSFIGSMGCPISSYKGLLSLVETRRLKPRELVTRTVALNQVNEVLTAMSDFKTVGFNVITAF
jgi:D-arabinose 1-dehydrogenase-like Zn-dependent alcohol dehydrogenase